MSALTHPVVVLGVLSTALALLIAGVTWQQRATRGARTYTALMVTLAVWSTLYVGQLLVPTVEGKAPWFVARHAMSPLFAMGFWVFAAQYTDRRELLEGRLLAPIVAVGLGFVALVLSNPRELYWSALSLAPRGDLLLLELSLGPLFWLNCVYIFGVVAAAHVIIVAAWKRTFASYRPQLLVMTVVGSIEFGLSLLFLSEHTALLPSLNPWPNVQLITYGATLAALPIGWSYVNDFLFDIQPLARQAVVESMDDAVYIVDSQGTIRYTNPPGNRLLGRPADADAPPEHVSAAFASRPTLLSCYEHAADGAPVGDDTILACDIDGEQRFYDIGVSTIQNSTGERAGVVVVGRDITEERRQRGQLQVRTAQLERQNERLEQFGQYVSHDLRNPIQVASGYVELARETEDLSRLDDIDRAIHRMSEMVEDLRELTAVDRDSLDVDRVNVARAAHTAWAHVDTDGATLRVPDNDIILADEDYLLHVFENLFRNSVEHGLPDDGVLGDGGGLTVTVGPIEGGFFVADDGVGIPQADREAVLDHGYTTTAAGTGLGMSIVRTITDAHQWSVTVTESDGGGARFEFRNVDTPEE